MNRCLKRKPKIDILTTPAKISPWHLCRRAYSTLSDWVEAPAIGVKVNSRTGAIVSLTTNRSIPVYRNKVNGTILGYVPRNSGQAGLGKGRIHQLGRIILSVLNAVEERSPLANPRRSLVVPKDGNKWNIIPSNLEWVRTSEFMHRKIMMKDFPLKLDGYTVLTLREVMRKLDDEKIYDYDAVGSVFGVGGSTVCSVVRHRSWAFVDKFIKEITPVGVNFKINKAREAVEDYSECDQELINYMTLKGSVD